MLALHLRVIREISSQRHWLAYKYMQAYVLKCISASSCTMKGNQPDKNLKSNIEINSILRAYSLNFLKNAHKHSRVHQKCHTLQSIVLVSQLNSITDSVHTSLCEGITATKVHNFG